MKTGKTHKEINKEGFRNGTQIQFLLKTLNSVNNKVVTQMDLFQ